MGSDNTALSKTEELLPLFVSCNDGDSLASAGSYLVEKLKMHFRLIRINKRIQTMALLVSEVSF